jgi:hypothetical protein
MSLLVQTKTPYYQCKASGPDVTVALKHLLYLTLIFQRKKEAQILQSSLVDWVRILLYLFFFHGLHGRLMAIFNYVSFWFHL